MLGKACATVQTKHGGHTARPLQKGDGASAAFMARAAALHRARLMAITGMAAERGTPRTAGK